MKKERRQPTREFKLEILHLPETSGKSANVLDEGLGLGKGCILRWKTETEGSGPRAVPGHGRLTPEQELLRQMEQDLKIVRQERDILKAVAIFSHPSG